MLKKSLLLATTLAATAVWAQAPTPASVPPVQVFAPATESQRFAHDRLLAMARFLGNSQRFSAALRISYDAVQDDGQKIEFGEVRDVAVERPNRVRVAETSSDGSRGLMLFDGERITISSGTNGLYAQTLQPGNIDDTVVHYVRDLKMRLPLAPVLMSRLADELQRRLTGIDYVERSALHGKPVHHIAGRTAVVDFQVWIADGRKPLPERIVITYKAEPGQPQFRADFGKWNLAPKFDQATFRFKPAPNSSRIMFAVQVPPELIDTRRAAAQTKGESK